MHMMSSLQKWDLSLVLIFQGPRGPKGERGDSGLPGYDGIEGPKVTIATV